MEERDFEDSMGQNQMGYDILQDDELQMHNY